MSGLEADTIGGFNSMIEKQKKEEGDALVSVVLFDDRMEVLYDRVPIRKVEPMTEKQYFVRGCTALLDAVGGAIHHIRRIHKYDTSQAVPGKTLFIITTDGMENSSRKYIFDKVREMIKKRENKDHWRLSLWERTWMPYRWQAGSASGPAARLPMNATEKARRSTIRL